MMKNKSAWQAGHKVFPLEEAIKNQEIFDFPGTRGFEV
jgi:hypothetical protein